MKKKYCISVLVSFIICAQVSFSGDNNSLESEIKLKLKEKNKNTLPINESGTRIQTKPMLTNNKIKLAEDKKKYKVSPLKMTILAVAGAGVFTSMHIYYSNTWWKDKRDYFKFAQDGYYARNMDKASHVYTANVFTEITAIAYEWAGISPSKALLYGAITSMAYETYIEINDGFAPNWGFDWGDMGANIFGAVYPFIQREVKPLQNVNFKWSFNPKWISKKASATDDLLDDYTNMTFWMSVNPELVLPKSVTNGKFYPNFLAVALGMSVKGASHVSGSTTAYAEWYLALDYDLRKLPGKSDFMKKLKKILNFYHFPSPAVRISPSGIWYGLYF
jgi:hypothetical protein